ncbi:MAG: hypothetical protein K8L99_31870 [Anaerolineae bacterium]|nr:hypothetical protein [Anaerolineae bacterium]
MSWMSRVAAWSSRLRGQRPKKIDQLEAQCFGCLQEEMDALRREIEITQNNQDEYAKYLKT